MHILGNHGVVQAGPLRFWAERGLICVEDARDNSYDTIPVREMLLRMNAISEMLRNPIRGTESKAERAAIMEEREEQQKLLEGMIEVVRRAREQGMPTDKTATHALKAARPKTVVMPGSDSMGGLFDV